MMAEMTTCRDCGKRYMHLGIGLNIHRCEPVYHVWCPEDGETEERDARPVWAFDAESAAERWAEENDPHCDHHLLSGGEVVVHVRAPDGSLNRFKVTGEAEPTYYAEALPCGGDP